METSELLKKVRKIEIKTKGLSKQVFSGEYHSAFKGRGMAFSEVRNYIPGDEIRTIDWNVTARFNEPYVKVFEEERELTVMLIVDISGSESFGSDELLKREFIAEIGAVLAFSATQNNDKIGAILFSDQIELYIPPKKGRKHILRIIRELIEFKPKSNLTNIGEVVQHFNNLVKKRAIAFLISDFIGQNLEKALKISNNQIVLMYNLAENYKSIGEFNKAIEMHEKIIFDNNYLTVINDSKSTSLASSESLLKNLKNVYWILCGIPKKQDRFNLTKFQCKNFKGYIFGKYQLEFSKILKNKLTIKKFKNIKDTLNQIFLEIKNNKREKNTILFSPAGASFDNFKNFEDRGLYFNQIIKKYLNEK